MEKIKFLYGKEVVVLPSSAITKIDRASKRDIKVLLAAASSENLRGDKEKLAALCGITLSELEASLSFWLGAGVISLDDEDVVASPEVTEPKKVSIPDKKPETTDEAPIYTTSELNKLMESRKEISLLIDECQRLLGKMFNPHEISIIVTLVDYLELDSAYIVTLVDYCSRSGKKSLQYVKKLAFGFYDEGITELPALNAKIQKLETVGSIEGEIRKLFGMNDRALTTKEKKFINAWVCDFGYGIDVIKKAYEETVNATNKPSASYANAILERWNKEGLRDVAAIDAAKSEKMPTDGSFNTNDFLDAAIRRTFDKKEDA